MARTAVTTAAMATVVIAARAAARAATDGLREVDGGGAVVAKSDGSELRATQVGIGQIGLTEVDEGVAEAAIGSELRAT
eukprot:scaffold42119_cov77-Phaeocystis_antarctica.AAC.2